MGFEEARQYRHSLVDVLWRIVELHMIRAFYDMELFIGTCSALIQIVAHPFASRHTSGHDLQRLRKEYFRHVVCVIRDDLIEASSGRKTRSGWILATWGVVILPGFLQFLIRGIFLA